MRVAVFLWAEELSEVGLKDRRIIRCQCNSAEKQGGATGRSNRAVKQWGGTGRRKRAEKIV